MYVGLKHSCTHWHEEAICTYATYIDQADVHSLIIHAHVNIFSVTAYTMICHVFSLDADLPICPPTVPSAS